MSERQAGRGGGCVNVLERQAGGGGDVLMYQRGRPGRGEGRRQCVNVSERLMGGGGVRQGCVCSAGWVSVVPTMCSCVRG